MTLRSSWVVNVSGASVNATKIHRSALHIAAANSRAAEVAFELLEFGADVYARDNQGHTPRDLTLPGSVLYLVLQRLEGEFKGHRFSSASEGLQKPPQKNDIIFPTYR